MDEFRLTQSSQSSSQPELTPAQQQTLNKNLGQLEGDIGIFLNHIKKFIDFYDRPIPAAKYQIAEFLDEKLLNPLQLLRARLPETEKQEGVRVANRVAYLRSLPERGGRSKTKKRRSTVKKTRSSFHN